VLEPRLRVALQNSKHRLETGCPLFTPDDAQNLLLGYAQEARNENPSPGNGLLVILNCQTSDIITTTTT